MVASIAYSANTPAGLNAPALSGGLQNGAKSVQQWLTQPQLPYTSPNQAIPAVTVPYNSLATGTQNPHWPFSPQTHYQRAATWNRTVNFFGPGGLFPIRRARNATTQP
jgi:hypothetical protein